MATLVESITQELDAILAGSSEGGSIVSPALHVPEGKLFPDSAASGGNDEEAFQEFVREHRNVFAPARERTPKSRGVKTPTLFDAVPNVTTITVVKPKDTQEDELDVWDRILASGEHKAIAPLETSYSKDDVPSPSRGRLLGAFIAEEFGIIGEDTAENILNTPPEQDITEILSRPFVTADQIIDEQAFSQLVANIDAEIVALLGTTDDGLVDMVNREIAAKNTSATVVVDETVKYTDATPLEVLEGKESKKKKSKKAESEVDEKDPKLSLKDRLAKAKEKIADVRESAIGSLNKLTEPHLDEVREPGMDFEIITDRVLREEQKAEESLPQKIRVLLENIKEGRIPDQQSARARLISVAIAAGMALPHGLLVTIPDKNGSGKINGNPPAAATVEVQSLDLPKAEVEKPFVQKFGELVYPEGVDQYTYETFIQMPEIKGLLRFMTSNDIGEEGKGSNTTPPDERSGRPELLAGINTVAKAYQAKYKNSYLLIGDLNAPDHASHKDGVDVDIYLPNDGLRILDKNDPKREFTKQRAIDIGKMLIDTGITDLIFYNDQEVIDAINNYAILKGIDIGANGIMQKSGDNHNSHMHWRIEKKAETIKIPWMPEEVKKWDKLVIEKSKKYGVNPEFASIIIYKESAGNPNAKSWVGATGLMQIMPETGASIAKERGITNYDLSDPETNIDYYLYR